MAPRTAIIIMHLRLKCPDSYIWRTGWHIHAHGFTRRLTKEDAVRQERPPLAPEYSCDDAFPFRRPAETRATRPCRCDAHHIAVVGKSGYRKWTRNEARLSAGSEDETQIIRTVCRPLRSVVIQCALTSRHAPSSSALIGREAAGHPPLRRR